MEKALNVKKEEKEVVKQHKVRKTPFEIIEREKDGKKEYFAVWGCYRLSPQFNSKLKTKWWLKRNKMEVMTTYISIIAEKVYDIKKNERKEKETSWK